MKVKKVFSVIVQLAIIVALIGIFPASAAPQEGVSQGNGKAFKAPAAKFSNAVAFDKTAPLRDLATQRAQSQAAALQPADDGLVDVRPDRGPMVADQGYAGDGALQSNELQSALSGPTAAAISAPLVNFEGLSNLDNFNTFGFRVNPPDPNGDVGPNHYVEMINLVFAVYDKQGNLLLGPVDTGTLWADFPVEDCTDPSGDPIVIYDQLEDRWLLTQFTTRGPAYYDCVAISQTGDPTGAYYRYAFITQPDPDLPGGTFFPDYPKYGVWTDSYIMTTRDFGEVDEYGISIYALEKNKMLAGNPNARAVQFFLDSNDVPLELIGDGLLPPDIDGTRRPIDRIAAPIVGTQDDDYVYGAAFDALNIWELWVQWNSKPDAWVKFAAQLPVAEFDSAFPCGPSRGCIPQPGITNPDQYLDILSYRQRPTWRLAYRNFGKYEAMVTNQSVEALPGIAGVRWYEIRRVNSAYSLYQQGTFAPGDGVHRWMGSAAMDKFGNIALGYSVSNATDVYPGIRYTGRSFDAPLGQMNLGEGVIMNGTGVQTTTNSRWGDYTSLNIDPVDDCTFWYVNEYYQVSGLPLPLPPPPLPPPGTTAPWQTRIASFQLPGCQ
ncbi:MAG: hypothetical protein A2W35_07410 [Chloroflexi bacterium RBG_16_57_11]|nr:MAG: hypothetical protein A2W35_07410 [Chloroflexi bacterium RBG_16_57_11]